MSLDGEKKTMVLQTGKKWQVQLEVQATPGWDLPFQANASFEFQAYKVMILKVKTSVRTIDKDF